MSSYLTEAEELTRRYDLAQHEADRRTPPPRAPTPHPADATRVAAGLRRVADRLEQ